MDLLTSHLESKNELCQLHLNIEHSRYIQIYTGWIEDYRETCGCGLYIDFVKQSVRYDLHSSPSIHSAELFAIYKSLVWVGDNRNVLSTNMIAIYPDSLSALEAIKSRSVDKFLINSVLSICLELSKEGLSIAIVGMAGHAGIGYNHIADELAKDGYASQDLQDESIDEYLQSIREYKALASHHCRQQWLHEFDQTETGPNYERFSPDEECWNKTLPRLSKRNSSIIFRIQTGHCRLYHLKRIGLDDDGFCSLCKVPETVVHLPVTCPP